MRKLVVLSFVTFAAPLLLCAQPKWEAGLSGGITNYFGDFNLYFLPPWAETNPAFSGFVRRNLNANWSLRANYLYGRLSGNDANYGSRRDRGFVFESIFSEVSFLVEWDAHGKMRFREEGFHNTLSSYFFAGPSVSLFNTTIDYNLVNGVNPVVDPGDLEADMSADRSKPVVAAILGGGAKYDYNERVFFFLEAGLRPTLYDQIDGVSNVGNKRIFDWYFFIGLGGGLRIVGPDLDSDNDGIADSKDECPNNVGPPQFKGCPDTDADGIPDKIDACPNERGSTALRGCPFVDADNDGIPDDQDKCPNEAGSPALKGCPDQDGDGVGDGEDRCPTVAGPAPLQGCPDTDGDGIIDILDKCPDVAGRSDLEGCLFKDTDNDGVDDSQDKCPDIAGSSATQGCPEMNPADKSALEAAAKRIQFEVNTDLLTADAKVALDRISAVLIRYPGQKVLVEAHTDNAGTDAANQDLSERRAKRCLDYLTGKGVKKDNLTAKGFGESRPLADNNTAEGRKLNRRVILVLL